MEKLNAQTRSIIEEIVERHRGKKGPVKLMLHDVQRECGYIPFEAMVMIGDACGVSAAQVYGVVTFYSQFTTQPKGKHVVNICMGTACYVKGAQQLIETLCEACQCEINQTSKDGLFSIDATRCLGACGLAPVAIIDDKVHGNITDMDSMRNLISAIRASEA